MPPARALSRSLATVAAAALLLSGCALAPTTDVTDQQARDRFIAHVDTAQGAAGGSWETKDDPSPRECTIPLWVTGARIPALRTGPAPADGLEAAAGRMQRHFTDAGMRTTVSEIGDVVEVRAETPAGELLLFRVSETAMTITGESECRPA
ncbi:MAG: hypothetical protein ACXIUP_00400 [Microcella sp.]